MGNDMLSQALRFQNEMEEDDVKNLIETSQMDDEKESYNENEDYSEYLVSNDDY